MTARMRSCFTPCSFEFFSISWSRSCVAIASQGGGTKRDAIPSTQGTVKKDPGAVVLPVTEVTCFCTEARCCSMELATVERAESGDAGTAWADITSEDKTRAKIHFILSFYRSRT